MPILGTDAVLKRLDNLKASMNTRVKAVVRRAAKACYSDSQDNCPVGNSTMAVSRQGGGTHVYYSHEAGSLKGSGVIAYPTEFSASVSYGGESSTGEVVDYQWYVELGTYKMSSQPFLHPAFVYAEQLFEIDIQGIMALNSI